MRQTILDLCGGTGAWSQPYRDSGYNVINVTLPEYDVLTYKPPDNIHGILAAPPCTEFSLAAGKKLAKRNPEKGLILIKACLDIIWRCMPEFWALENPVGFLRRFLGQPTFTFRQWEFGDRGIKPTDLWGYFNIPKKSVFTRPEKKDLLYIAAGGSRKRATRIKGVDYRQSIIAAKTPSGFANAFYNANK